MCAREDHTTPDQTNTLPPTITTTTTHNKMTSSCRLSTLLAVVAAIVLASAEANLLCWTNYCTNGSDWCLQTCSQDHVQRSCLAQYRLDEEGKNVASYFGCHSVPCSHECVPIEGSSHDFSCCCSGDLCNSIPGLTPTRETPTGTYNPSEPPSIDPHDGACVSASCRHYNVCVPMCTCVSAFGGHHNTLCVSSHVYVC